MADAEAVLKAWFEMADSHDTSNLDELVTHDCEMVAPGAVLRGPDQIKPWMQAFFNAFPDISHPIDRMVVAGDVVTTELTLTGTHTGALRSAQGEVPPTGKEISMRVANVTTVEGERISGVHVYFDQMEFLGQLGLLPS